MATVYKEEVKRLNMINFWRGEYIKRKALIELGDKIKQIENIVTILNTNQDPKLGSDTIRYTLNAIYSRNEFGGSSYDISSIPETLISYYNELLPISLHYGYSADILIDRADPVELINLILDENKLPDSPPPFRSNSQHPFLYKIIQLITIDAQTNSEYFPVGDPEKTALLDEIANIKHNQICSDQEELIKQKHHKIKKEIELLTLSSYSRRISIDRIGIRSTWSEQEKLDLLKVYKKSFPLSFNSDSNITRAQGLYLWDNKHFKIFNKESYAIENMRKKPIPEHDGLENIPIKNENGASDPYFRRIRRKTDQCIKEGAVLTI